MGVGRCFMLGGPTTSYSACSKKQKLRITLAIMQNYFHINLAQVYPFNCGILHVALLQLAIV